MSLNTITSAQLLPVAIVAIGTDAANTASGLAVLYPSALATVALQTGSLQDVSQAASLAAEVLASLTSACEAGGTGSGLPAIVVLASTGDGAQVADFLSAVRDLPSPLRPRVWPTFVSGDSAKLADFDGRLDDIGAGACDLVLMMNGKATAAEKAAALGAWLHVKMPAPPSVLGELPDIDGKICRYVAIGSSEVSPAASSTPIHAAAGATFDAAAVTFAVAAAVTESAASAACVIEANASATALSDSAERFDSAALLRSENQLSHALADVAYRLPQLLAQSLPNHIEAHLNEVHAGSTSAAPTASGAEVDRTEAVSQLVLLASKGGLSKMLSRSRMAGISQSISAAARRDVAGAVAKAIDDVCLDLPTEIESWMDRRAAADVEQRRASAAAAAEVADESWRLTLAACRDAVTLWPRVDASGVRRSWGGSAPSPRQYVVGSELALRGLPDDDDALSVIDTRRNAGVSGTSVRSEGIDLRDGSNGQQERRATVLLAQYGLPLTAFPS